MATEGPLFHDGTQTTAFANYYNGAAFLGVGGTGQFLVVSLQAPRIVQICPGPTTVPYGILQNTPMATDPADVGIFGITKAVAGAAITAGVALMAGTAGTLGQVVTYASSGYRLGIALESASAQGVVFTMMLLPTWINS